MSLNLNNVEILGYSRQNNFFGEKSFNYSARQNVSVRGRLLGTSGSIMSQMRGMQQGSTSFTQVSINGASFGMGKVIGLEFEDGTWAEDAIYIATIEIIEQATLGQVPGASIVGKELHLLKSFSENLTLDFDSQNEIVGGDHSIEIQYDANGNSSDLMMLAKGLANELLSTLPTNLKGGNYTTRGSNSFRYLFSESYDIINGKCGFSKKFSYRTNNSNNPFSINRNVSASISTNGVIVVEEDCEIKAETLPLYESALAGYTQEIGSSFGRCSAAYNNFKNQFPTNLELNSDPIQKTTQINKTAGIINYKIVYDNDQKKVLKDYTWENTLILELQNNYINIVSEEGKIIGKKNPNETFEQKYLKAQNGWSAIQIAAVGRINSHWQNTRSKASTNLKPFKKDISRLPYQGIINYKISYTDDPSIIQNGDVRKLNIEIKQDTEIPPLFKNFIIPNSSSSYPIRQTRNLKKQGTYEVSIKAQIAFKERKLYNGFDYFNVLKALVPQPNQNDQLYIESVNFQSDEIEQNANYNIIYKYS
jgi:hypothetical protein